MRLTCGSGPSCVSLRDNVWRPRLAEVARLGRRTSPPNPDADLADVMRTDALSNGYSARSLFGRHYLEHLREFIGQNLDLAGFTPIQDAITGDILQRLGFPWRSRLSHATYADALWRVSAPLIQGGEVSRWRKLEPNYIAALLADSSIATLVASQPGEGTSLLQALLRHSMLLEYASATAAIAGTEPGASLAALLRDPELIDLVNGVPLSTTWKRLLDRKVAAITGTKTIREHLDSLQTFNAPQVAALGAFRDSLEHLQGLDSEALQFLMQGTIDLASYRLDAWITSFATKRLATHARVATAGRLRRRLRLGREPQARNDCAHRGHAAAGRSGAALRARQRYRLHSRAIDDACLDRGTAAQRAARQQRRGGIEWSVCDRPVVAACARSELAARWRATGATARGAARLSIRATPARPAQGSVHRAAARARAIDRPQAGEHESAGRKHRGEQRRRRSGAESEVAGREADRDEPPAERRCDCRRSDEAEPGAGWARGLDRCRERRADCRDGLSDGSRQHVAPREHAQCSRDG